ncbi:DUF1877 family protein [Streptomyces globisporus]|uniref:DUF1877 family protein n=1 Tax=Streptomyces globisporus TaxID=1908 RepID=UPI0004CA9A27|nr:DUF1877 family protein [Streptomyces globisporus]
MSIHVHFRAVAASEIREDHTWLTAYMWKAWDEHVDECEAGVATSIAKVWDAVADLYAAAADAVGADADAPWTLPIYGGRPVAHGAGADLHDPPMIFMDPPEVSLAADFLAAVSFDGLWNSAGTRFGGRGPDHALFRQEYLEHHESLRSFYAQAASWGHAVVKVVWA